MPATLHSIESHPITALSNDTLTQPRASPNRCRQHRNSFSVSSSTVLPEHELELWGLTSGTDDVSICQYGPDKRKTLESILVPIAGGPNSYRAVQVATDLATTWNTSIELVTIVSPSADRTTRMESDARLANYADELNAVPVRTDVLVRDDVVATISERSHNHDLIVIGQTNQSLLTRLFKGTVPSKLQQQTEIPIFVVEDDTTPSDS